METQAVIEAVGKNVVLAAHEHFIEAHLDNAEYLPALRVSIQAIGKSATDLLSAEAGTAMKVSLEKYARHLFVEIWLKLAEEDGDSGGDILEQVAAIRTFDEIYNSREDLSDC